LKKKISGLAISGRGKKLAMPTSGSIKIDHCMVKKSIIILENLIRKLGPGFILNSKKQF
jgi:hypothetical protein